jgi:hypothetical protein
MHGRRYPIWSANTFRKYGDNLWNAYEGFGFTQLNEFILTHGRHDPKWMNSSDGWHFHGSQKQMECVVLLNMICND